MTILALLLSLLIMFCCVVSAFWGYKLWRIFRFFPGLVAGFLIGSVAGFLTIPRTELISALLKMTGGDNSLLMTEVKKAVIFGLLLGILLGIVSVIREKVSIFLEFFSYGFLLTFIFLAREALSSWESILSLVMDGYSGIIIRIIVPAAVVGCIAGLLGMHLSRIWIIISTAFWGGVTCSMTIGSIMPIIMPIGILMIPAGIVYQLKTTGNRKKKETVGQVSPSQPQSQPSPGMVLPMEPQEKAQQPAQSVPEVTFCGKCGAKIERNGAFCPKCGSKVR